jgi:ribosomal protein S18 acetylase RimI-like enzyme
MEIAIVRAHIPKDARALANLERKAFLNGDDWAPPSFYYGHRRLRSFWLLQNGRRIGVTCLVHHATISSKDGVLYAPMRDALYIVSTSVLPRFQGYGFGGVLKAWHIAYARKKGFKKIVTNARAGNIASIHLNLKFGFAIVGEIANCYPDGETGIVLEMNLAT